MVSYNKMRLLIILFVFIVIVSVFFVENVTVESINTHKELIRNFVRDYYFLSVFLFFLSCVFFINSPVPFAAIVKIIGGFIFGVYLGSLFNIFATVLACMVGFYVSRYALKEAFEKKYYKKLEAVETEIERNGFYYFISARMIMVVPYFLINILAGISRISFTKYFFSTVIGVIPASLVYANGGSKLEQINSVSELFSLDVIVAMIFVLLILLTPLLLKVKNSG